MNIIKKHFLLQLLCSLLISESLHAMDDNFENIDNREQTTKSPDSNQEEKEILQNNELESKEKIVAKNRTMSETEGFDLADEPTGHVEKKGLHINLKSEKSGESKTQDSPEEKTTPQATADQRPTSADFETLPENTKPKNKLQKFIDSLQSWLNKKVQESWVGQQYKQYTTKSIVRETLENTENASQDRKIADQLKELSRRRKENVCNELLQEAQEKELHNKKNSSDVSSLLFDKKFEILKDELAKSLNPNEETIIVLGEHTARRFFIFDYKQSFRDQWSTLFSDVRTKFEDYQNFKNTIVKSYCEKITFDDNSQELLLQKLNLAIKDLQRSNFNEKVTTAITEELEDNYVKAKKELRDKLADIGLRERTEAIRAKNAIEEKNWPETLTTTQRYAFETLKLDPNKKYSTLKEALTAVGDAARKQSTLSLSYGDTKNRLQGHQVALQYTDAAKTLKAYFQANITK